MVERSSMPEVMIREGGIAESDILTGNSWCLGECFQMKRIPVA